MNNGLSSYKKIHCSQKRTLLNRTIQGEKQCKDASVWRGPGGASQVKLNLIKISVESEVEENQETSENNFAHAQVPQAQHSNTAQPGGEGSQKQSDRGRAFQV